MLKPVTGVDLGHGVDLLCEGFPERRRAWWEKGLARLDNSGLNGAVGVPLGFFLMEGAERVGVALTPASLRHGPDGAVRRMINLSSWYIRPEHRWRAPMMLRGLIADPDATYTDFTPTEPVRKLLLAFGFRPVSEGVTIRALATLGLRAAGGVRVRDLRPEDVFAAPAPGADLVRTHRDWGCEPLVLESGGRVSLVVWRRIALRGLPAADILYADDLALLEEGAGALARHLLFRGVMFLVSEARGEASRASRHFRPHGTWFAKNGFHESRIDRLGSELCFLDP
jgi:hypothetical protein